jgi:hypothetical protein
MGSSFEDLGVTSLTVQTDFQSNKWFELESFLNFWISTLNTDDEFQLLQVDAGSCGWAEGWSVNAIRMECERN